MYFTVRTRWDVVNVQRNPDIKLYGLPWTFPGWLGTADRSSPYQDRSKLVTYFLNWVRGANEHHNLTVDYLGVCIPFSIAYWCWVVVMFINLLGCGTNKSNQFNLRNHAVLSLSSDTLHLTTYELLKFATVNKVSYGKFYDRYQNIVLSLYQWKKVHDGLLFHFTVMSTDS